MTACYSCSGAMRCATSVAAARRRRTRSIRHGSQSYCTGLVGGTHGARPSRRLHGQRRVSRSETASRQPPAESRPAGAATESGPRPDRDPAPWLGKARRSRPKVSKPNHAPRHRAARRAFLPTRHRTLAPFGTAISARPPRLHRRAARRETGPRDASMRRSIASRSTRARRAVGPADGAAPTPRCRQTVAWAAFRRPPRHQSTPHHTSPRGDTATQGPPSRPTRVI